MRLCRWPGDVFSLSTMGALLTSLLISIVWQRPGWVYVNVDLHLMSFNWTAVLVSVYINTESIVSERLKVFCSTHSKSFVIL